MAGCKNTRSAIQTCRPFENPCRLIHHPTEPRPPSIHPTVATGVSTNTTKNTVTTPRMSLSTAIGDMRRRETCRLRSGVHTMTTTEAAGVVRAITSATTVRKASKVCTAHALRLEDTNSHQPCTLPMTTLSHTTRVMDPTGRINPELPMATKVQRQSHPPVHRHHASSTSSLRRPHLTAFIIPGSGSGALTLSLAARCTCTQEDTNYRGSPIRHGGVISAGGSFAFIQRHSSRGSISFLSLLVGMLVVLNVLVPVKG